MDAELLEAALSPLLLMLRSNRSVTENKSANHKLALFLFNLEETPMEVQQQVDTFVSSYSQQVRLIAWTHRPPAELQREQKLFRTCASNRSFVH